MTGTRNVVIATLVAPWAVVPVTALFSASLGIPNTSPIEALSSGTTMGLVGVVYGYAATIIYGLPMFYLLRHLNRLNVWSLSAAGFLAPFALIALPGFPWRMALWWALCGLAVALVAWLLACWWSARRSNNAVHADARHEAGARG